MDRCIERAVGAEPVDREDARAAHVQPLPGLRLPPAALGMVIARQHMAMRGNAAGDDHYRRARCTDVFVGDAQAAFAGMAQRQHGVDFAARGGRVAGDRRLRSRFVIGLGTDGVGEVLRGAIDEAHGGCIPDGRRPLRTGHRGCGCADVEPHRADTAQPSSRRTQVPAGIGTTPKLALRQVAPASKGLSLSRSRWMAAACQRFSGLSIASCA
jgi:hypothetical protein